MVSICLVDAEQQWFTLRAGELSPVADATLCAAAIRQPDLWIVPDILADDGVAGAAQIVSGSNVRFYAGVPLRAGDGQAVGVLSVMDAAPRALAAEQQALLRAIGLQVIRQLELQRALTELPQAVAARSEAQNAVARLASFPEQNPHPVVEVDLDGTVSYCNPAARNRFPDLAAVGLAHPFLRELQASIAALQKDDGEAVIRELDLGDAVYEQRLRLVPDTSLIRVFGYDVTARKRAEEEHARLQEEVIRAQAARLAELSTPLIPLSEQIVIMPLIGTIDTERAAQVLETLLRGIADHRAQIAVLDITGVPLVDSQVADALIRAAQAARLLGAQVVLSGIGPEVAQTLTGLGLDLRGIVTQSTVQRGIAYALGRS